MAKQIVKSNACFQILSKREREVATNELNKILTTESKNIKVVDTITIRIKKSYTGKLIFENVNNTSSTCPTNKLASITVEGMIKQYNLKQRKKYIAGINDLGQVITIIKEVK